MTEQQFHNKLQELDLKGRDGLHTHLLSQEFPIWFGQVGKNSIIPESEVKWIIERRGFNEMEAGKLRNLVKFVNEHREIIEKFRQKP